ncbi:MAG: LuxR C-terminal-related transcriptional regulator [Pseudomonadota bacterium]
MKARPNLDRTLKRPLTEAKRLLVHRERLLALDVGLPIFVIEGPSGYGKTILAEIWLSRHRQQGRCSWLSLDKSCGDPITFLNKVLEAIGADVPRNEEAGIDGAAGRSERFDALCTHLASAESHCYLVLDDVHTIAERSARVYLERLLTLTSNKLSICLTMQPFDIELGLGRLAGEGKVTWVQAADLAMTRDEVRELSWLRGRVLNDSQLASLYRVTEGWPALTQIALVSPIEFNDELIARDAPGSAPLRDFIYKKFIQTLSDDDKEVLWTLCCIGSAPISLLMSLNPPESKVETAILRFRALGLIQNRDPEDCSIVCLHALIREVASRVLLDYEFRTKTEILRDAAQWKWDNGQSATAVSLALEAGPDLSALAGDWIKQLGFNFLFRTGQHQTLLELIDRWESAAKSPDPEIDSIAVWGLTFQRQFALAEPRLNRIELSSNSKLHDALPLQRAVIAALRDDFLTCRALSQQWVQNNEGRHSFEMGVASTVFAFGLKFTAEFDRAQAALRDAIYGFNTAQSSYGIGWAHVAGAMVLIQSGRFRAALAQIDAGLLRCPSSQGFGSLRTMLKAQEAFLRYERNELERVREILAEELPLLSDQGLVDAVSVGYAAAVRARAANGDYGTALDILSEGELVAQQRDFQRLYSTLRMERALLLIRSGAPNQAKPLLQSINEERFSKTTKQLLKARIAIADGEGHLAQEVIVDLIARLRIQERQNRLCEALLLLALAEDLCGNDKASLKALGEALEIGSVEGYLRTFLDEGKVVMDMIERWLDHGSAAGRPAISLAKQLISLSGAPTRSSVPNALVIVFNKRERQILALLNEGLSNAQLAQRCFITEGTVKWYLHNLYEKFGVGNRTALLRATREQELKR